MSVTEDRLEKFFISIGPGFERLSHLELVIRWNSLRAFFSLPEVPEVKEYRGGLEVQVPKELGFYLNHILKIPNRILWRLLTVNCDNFDDFIELIKPLKKKVSLKKVKLSFSSKSSLINNEKTVTKLLSQAGIKVDKSAAVNLHIRFFRDELTVSVDTSGDALYQRGANRKVGKAPLRDNLAAGVLRWALQATPSGQSWELIDPMCGSGVFLSEALNLSSPLKRPFAYHDHLGFKKVAAEGFELPEEKIGKCYGYDFEKLMVQVSDENLRAHKGKYHVSMADLFKSEYKIESESYRVVISNPPYGQRLKAGKIDYFESILQNIITKFNPNRICLVWPKDIDVTSFKLPDNWSVVRSLYFENGGIPVKASLFVRDKL